MMQADMSCFYILCGALLIDLTLGEAPDKVHPVAWLGKLISLQLKLPRPAGKTGQFIQGTIMVTISACVITATLYCMLQYIQQFNIWIYILIASYLLKNTFSLRGLWQAVDRVRVSLISDDLAKSRQQARTLVSRDTATLSTLQVISSAVESCSENLCDSFIAPLLYCIAFGLPGAVFYRIVNTYDAMIGYHGKWEYSGKFAARLDDMLNYVPARLSALLIVLASGVIGGKAGKSWHTMVAQHGRTESPNAGWTMCAMAGSLGITLEKPGHYVLEGGPADLNVNTIALSQQVMLSAATIWIIIICIVEGFIGLPR